MKRSNISKLKNILNKFNRKNKPLRDLDTSKKTDIKNNTSSSESKKQIINTTNDLNETVEIISESINELSNFTDDQAESIDQFSITLENISQSVQQTALNAQQAASHVDLTLYAVTEMLNSIESVNGIINDLSKEATNSKSVAKSGEEVISGAIVEIDKVFQKVKDLSNSVRVLGESTEQIGGIIGIINGIATQTNMLALNASIEAARAGEYGRGFAVVARSIKDLADKSKEATNNIYGIINKIQDDIVDAVDLSNKGLEEIESGRELVKSAGESMKEIVTTIDKTYEYSIVIKENSELELAAGEEIKNATNELNAVIQEVSAITQEQAASIEETTTNVESIKESVFELASGAKEIATSSSYVMESTKLLAELTKDLK